MKIYSSLNEFLANSPKPGVRPGIKPGVEPGTKPKYPSPIRRDKPSVKPDPKAETQIPLATEEDLVKRFVSELRSQSKKVKIDYKSIKERYND